MRKKTIGEKAWRAVGIIGLSMVILFPAYGLGSGRAARMIGDEDIPLSDQIPEEESVEEEEEDETSEDENKAEENENK